MNGPPSDGNEGVIDIFVLSKSETKAPLQKERLEQKGYQITLFSDSTQLLETLRLGKPNLLICDTTTPEQEGYEICRQIKADDKLWMIPVLVLTGASDLGDLLNVLDSNADNFIAHPSESQYLLSLIESMLTTPVERQTPEQIKTQFKIQHDDRIYVVTADRRKLLEFLLSSFEIAVKKSEDLLRAHDEIQTISSAAKKLEESVAEHTRVIGIMNGTLQQKEQKITTLTGQLKDREQVISEKIQDIGRLAQDLDEQKALLKNAEERIRTMLQEKEETATSHRAGTDELEQQVSALSAELETTKTELKTTKADRETTRRALEQETAKRTTADRMQKEVAAQKEQLDTAFRALTREYEQLKVSAAAEKNRALSAEQEVRTVRQAKAQSEQGLTQAITELKVTARQQDSEIIRLKAELKEVTGRCIATEDQLGTVTREKELIESSLHSTADALRQDLGDLQAKFDTADAALEERKDTIQSLEQELAGETAEKERSIENLKNLSIALDEARSALAQEKDQHRIADQNLNAVILERDTALQSLRGSHAELKSDLDAHKDDLAQLKRDLEAAVALRSTLEEQMNAARARIKALEDELKGASQERAQSGQQARSLSDELEHVKAALETERRLHRASEGNLKAATQAKNRFEQELRRSTGEREAIKTALENERNLRQTAEEKARGAVRVQDRLEQELSTAAEEREREKDEHAEETRKLKTDLEMVLARQGTMENQVAILTREKEESEQKVNALSAELQQARTALAGEWEDQVAILTREKEESEQKVNALSAELQQARTALADEWEDHMTSDEQLAAAVEEKQQLQQSLRRAESEESGLKKDYAVVVQGPSLPAEVRPSPHAITTVDTPPVDKPESTGISGVEDLFEEDKRKNDTPPAMPAAAITQDPAAEGTAEGSAAGIPVGPGTHNEEPEEDQQAEDEDELTEGGEEDAEGHTSTLDEFGGIIPRGGIAINRQQWFDLLKWAHHSGAISREQRMQIVRMGRLIQKGRRLTKKQEERVKELILLVQTLGYQFT